MQVSVESASGLQRRIKVQVPAGLLEQAVEKRLLQLGSKAKLAGFRPGKVPMKVLHQYYGDQARQEAMGDLVQTTYFEALKQVDLNPAGTPQIEFQPQLAGQDLQYVATFDVYPEITLKGLDKLEVTKPVAEVTDADIERMLQSLREQRRSFEAADRAAAEGDQAMIDFEGTVDGLPFDGNKGESVPVEIGAGRFLKQMEQGLIGHKVADQFVIAVDFPADYPAEALKGRQAQFSVTLKSVSAPRLPELDDEFAKTAGVAEGGLEALRRKIQESLVRERDKAVTSRIKQSVFESLVEANPLELPQAMVAQESGRMRQEAAQRLPQQIQKEVRGNPEKLNSLFPEELFKKPAERRVALGLLISEIIKSRKIELDAGMVNKRVEDLARDYEKPDEVIKFYRSNPEVMQGIEAMVMEEQVVTSLLGSAKVKESPVSLESLMSPEHGEQGHVHGPDCDHDH